MEGSQYGALFGAGVTRTSRPAELLCNDWYQCGPTPSTAVQSALAAGIGDRYPGVGPFSSFGYEGDIMTTTLAISVAILVVSSASAAIARPSSDTEQAEMAHAGSTPMNRITAKQAVSLVERAVRQQIRSIPHHGTFTLDPMAIEPDERFLSYQALGVWKSDSGSAVIGNYSVNLQTGEVWDLTACQTVEFRGLHIPRGRYIVQDKRWRGISPPACRG